MKQQKQASLSNELVGMHFKIESDISGISYLRLYNLIEQGFVYGMKFFFGKGMMLSALLNQIDKTCSKKNSLTRTEYRGNYDHWIYELENDTVFVRKSDDNPNYILFFAKNSEESIVSVIKNKIGEKYVIPEITKDICVSNLYMTARGLASKDVNVGSEILNTIDCSLHPNLDILELSTQYIDSDESVLMLYGPPGTGKTTIIKMIICLLDKRFEEQNTDMFEELNVAYCKDMQAMNTGEFWADLSGKEFDLVILDDLDEGLEKRSESNSPIIMTNLLSVSDGIFSAKPKIIISTNKDLKDIDDALLRPGRCFDFIHLLPLPRDYARRYWVDKIGLSEAEFDSAYGYTGDDISQADLFSTAKKIKESHKLRSYIKDNKGESNISRRLMTSGVKKDDSSPFR